MTLHNPDNLSTAEDRADSEAAAEQLPVRTWQHSRKGLIRGVDVSPDPTSEFARIRLVGDHQLQYVSIDHRGMIDADGEILDVRRSFLTEVDS